MIRGFATIHSCTLVHCVSMKLIKSYYYEKILYCTMTKSVFVNKVKHFLLGMKTLGHVECREMGRKLTRTTKLKGVRVAS